MVHTNHSQPSDAKHALPLFAARIATLRAQITAYDEQYYAAGNTPVPDEHYDILRRELALFEHLVPSLAASTSPTNTVGIAPKTEWNHLACCECDQSKSVHK